jgi:hypothetical protein
MTDKTKLAKAKPTTAADLSDVGQVAQLLAEYTGRGRLVLEQAILAGDCLAGVAGLIADGNYADAVALVDGDAGKKAG